MADLYSAAIDEFISYYPLKQGLKLFLIQRLIDAYINLYPTIH